MAFLDSIVSRFCGKTLTPVDFTSLFLYILRDYFSDSNNILDPNLKDFTYSDGYNTKIIIESSGVWKPQTGDHRPAVLISRGQWKPQRLGAGYEIGSREKSAIRWSGNHNIICVGKTSAMCDLLVGEIAYFLLMVSPKILGTLPISEFMVNSISPIQPLDEGRMHFSSVITVVYSFDIRWEINITSQ